MVKRKILLIKSFSVCVAFIIMTQSLVKILQVNSLQQHIGERDDYSRGILNINKNESKHNKANHTFNNTYELYEGLISNKSLIEKDASIFSINDARKNELRKHLNTILDMMTVLQKYNDTEMKENITSILKGLKFKLEGKLFLAKAQHPEFIVNPSHICNDRKLFLLTIVHSASRNFEKRKAIRETWGKGGIQPHLSHRLVFAVGHGNTEKVNQDLLQEAKSYNDILYIDFMDTYRNLTFKALASHRWIVRNCMHTKFVLKSDDDAFVNIFKLKSHLQSMKQHLPENRTLEGILLCNIIHHSRPFRKDTKWRVSLLEYALPVYPSYCQGVAYVMSPDVVQSILMAAGHVDFLWIDDIFMTGILVSKTGIKHKNFKSVYVSPGNFVKFFTGTRRHGSIIGYTSNTAHIRDAWVMALQDYRSLTIKQRAS